MRCGAVRTAVGVGLRGARNAGVVVAAVAALLAAGPARAEGEAGSGLRATARLVTTMTRDRIPGAPGQTEWRAPTWQFLSVDGADLGHGLSLAANGWLAQDAIAASGPARRGNLSLGWIGWRGKDRRLDVKAGRQFVFAGGQRYALLDGVTATVQLPGSVRVEGHGGTATFAGFDRLFQAPVVGARLAWTPWLRGHVGASFQEVQHRLSGPASPLTSARRSVGADASLRGGATWLGTAAWSQDLLTGRLQHARVDASWRPIAGVQGWLRGEVKDPLAWLARDSIFLAFAQRTDQVAGGGLDVQSPGALGLAGSYERHAGEGGHSGYRARGEARLRFDRAARYRVGVAIERMTTGTDGYRQLRVWGTARPAGAVSIALDLDTYRFDQPVRGMDGSHLATLALRWTARRGVDLGLDGQLWQNPWFDRQALVLVTVSVEEKP